VQKSIQQILNCWQPARLTEGIFDLEIRIHITPIA